MVSSASGTAARLRRRSSPRRFPVRPHGGGEPCGSGTAMRVRVIAVGTRLPAWVRSACEEYLARLASRLAISLVEIEPGPRTAGGTAHKAIAAEGERLLGAVRPGDQVAILDQRGKQLSTRELATWL